MAFELRSGSGSPLGEGWGNWAEGAAGASQEQKFASCPRSPGMSLEREAGARACQALFCEVIKGLRAV